MIEKTILCAGPRLTACPCASASSLCRSRTPPPGGAGRPRHSVRPHKKHGLGDRWIRNTVSSDWLTCCCSILMISPDAFFPRTARLAASSRCARTIATLSLRKSRAAFRVSFFTCKAVRQQRRCQDKQVHQPRPSDEREQRGVSKSINPDHPMKGTSRLSQYGYASNAAGDRGATLSESLEFQNGASGNERLQAWR